MQNKKKVILKYDAPIIGWAFALILIFFISIFIFIFIRDQGFGQMPYEFEVLIMLGFGIFGISAAAYIFSKPIVRIQRENDKIVIKTITFYKKQSYYIPPNKIPDAYIIKDSDSDGDVYNCCFRISPEMEITFASHNQEELAKQKCSHFNSIFNT